MPTSLSAREIGLRLDGELKRAAMFSARVENARLLQKTRTLVGEIVLGATPEGEARRASGDAPLLKSMADAKADLLELLMEDGYEPAAPEDLGTIKDLRSDRRLDLILETNEALTHNHGRYLASQDATLLDAFPAWELVRISPAMEPRNWPTRWLMAGGQTFGGRMIALKGSPVWDALGSPRLFPDGLGNPYPPFAFNSGMDVRDISRDEAESLGLISPHSPAPAPDTRALTQGMRVSAEQFDSALQAALASDPDLVIQDGVLATR